MSTLELRQVRRAMDGPVIVAAAGRGGEPSIQLVGGALYVDEHHVALAYQYDYLVRTDPIASGYARLLAFDPVTAQKYSLLLRYERSETEGPLHEQLRAVTAAVAAHAMRTPAIRQGVVDVFRVLAVEPVAGSQAPAPPRADLLHRLAEATRAMTACGDVDALLDVFLDAVQAGFGVPHAMVLMRDAQRGRFVTIASRGYSANGTGAEVLAGEGFIGCAASLGMVFRIDNAVLSHARARVVRDQASARPQAGQGFDVVPLPGLPAPGSQLAVPIGVAGVQGMLYAEAQETYSFDADLEHALCTLARCFAMMLERLERLEREAGETGPVEAAAPVPPRATAGNDGTPLLVQFERRTLTVLVGGDYIIRGVAGAVLWRMLQLRASSGQTEFTNRALRLDPAVVLPDVDDNLAARLVLLQRRLRDRPCDITLEKSGRGRIALDVRRPLRLEELAPRG